MRILVVELNLSDRRAAEEQLGEHDLTFASFLDDAKDALQHGPCFDVVLTTLNMRSKGVKPWQSQPRFEPSGILLSLIALDWSFGGVKCVPLAAVVSFDILSEALKSSVIVNGLERLESAGRFKFFLGANCPEIEHTESSLSVKDWRKVFEELTAKSPA